MWSHLSTRRPSTGVVADPDAHLGVVFDWQELAARGRLLDAGPATLPSWRDRRVG